MPSTEEDLAALLQEGVHEGLAAFPGLEADGGETADPEICRQGAVEEEGEEVALLAIALNVAGHRLRRHQTHQRLAEHALQALGGQEKQGVGSSVDLTSTGLLAATLWMLQKPWSYNWPKRMNTAEGG